MSYGKNGYIKGKVTTFTPAATADWVDAFNDLLETKKNLGMKISRNALTAQLIENGLKYQRNQGIHIPTEGFSAEQVQLLNSEEGQFFLKNLIQMFLGQGGNQIAIPSFPNSIEGSKEIESKEDHAAHDYVAVTKEENIRSESQNSKLKNALELRKKMKLKM